MSIAFGEDRGGRQIVRKQVGLALSGHIADALIRKQAEILEAGRHPGVVELRGIEPISGPAGEPRLALVLTFVEGPTIDQIPLDAGQIAGLLAAVATIVADLHDRGVTHGALVAEHILLAGGSRPKLCGFGMARLTLASGRRRPPTEAQANSASTGEADVFALAMLGHDLLAHNKHIGLTPAKSNARSKRAWRNAELSLPRTLSDVLTSVPGRRLSARALADALAQCPGACLPRPNDECPSEPDPTAVVGNDPEATAENVASPPSGSEHLIDRGAGALDQSDLSAAPIDPGAIDPPAPALVIDHPPHQDEQGLTRWPSDDDVSAPHEEVSIPEPTRRRASTRPFRAATFAAGSLSVVALAAGAAALRYRAAPPVRYARTSVTTTQPGPTLRSSCRTVAGPAADLNGDGCGEPIAISGSTLRVGAVRFALGGPDDRAAVGDWDCDGWSTPVLLTSSTGSLYRYDEWPAEGRPEAGVSLGPVPHAVAIQPMRRSERSTPHRQDAGAAAPRSGRATETASRSPSCDDLLITRDDGSTVVVQARTDSR